MRKTKEVYNQRKKPIQSVENLNFHVFKHCQTHINCDLPYINLSLQRSDHIMQGKQRI